MADARGRAGGRARGRAKPPQQPPAEAPRPAGPPPAARPGPPPGMAGPAPGAPKPPGAPMSTGRATHRGVGRPVDESAVTQVQQKMAAVAVSGSGGNGNGNGSNGSNGAPVGRGVMRGKRQINVPTVRTRPAALASKKGTAGQPVLLQANYFSLVERTDWVLNQYRVDFAPEIDLLREKYRLMDQQRANIPGNYIFDGTVMYTSVNVHVDPTQPIEFFSSRESDDSQVRITIKHVGELMVGDHHYLQFFNILTKKCLKMLDLQLIKRDYFDPKNKVMIPEYFLELWPGYKTVIRQHDGNILMCAEITHKVMRTDTCLQLLQDCSQRSQSFREDFAKAVVGTVVLTDYNNKTYVISDIAWNENPMSTFNRSGTQVTYVSYYQERYNINIRDRRQPLLVSKDRPRDQRAKELAKDKGEEAADPKLTLLIPELCRMTGLNDEMRANFNLMRAMATHTRIIPRDRIERLMAMNRRLNSVERIRQEFQRWQLRLSDRLVEVPGRILPAESIVLGSNVTVPSGDECDWTRHLRSNPMFAMPQGGLSHWVALFPNRVGRDVESFVETLRQAAKGMKFNIAPPEYVDMPDDRNQTYVERLDQIISTMNPQLIFVVLMGQKADRYSAIKKKTLVDRAVPTQVLLAKNLNKKGVMSIATKVAIQINCKIGGAPWSVVMPLGGLMVIGFDVCHDSKSKGKSYGAMVASLNKPMSRYFSAVSHHGTGEELSNDLAMSIVKALQCYKKHNNALPSHLIIYRDGVGDGNIPYVFEHEVVQIQKAINDTYAGMPAKAKLGFVIVSKKINTRLFANQNNPRPGTVVDDVVTLPERYDFFIVSQHVNQGTVSPTSYNVIHDTLGLDPDKIQRLTYKLCHTYYNWSGTVRVPAPVQYAHKLAFLVSQSLYRAPNNALEELLYFL